jgi:hypothetical protein
LGAQYVDNPFGQNRHPNKEIFPGGTAAGRLGKPRGFGARRIADPGSLSLKSGDRGRVSGFAAIRLVR